MNENLERFLRYVKIDTQSDDTSMSVPSQAKELDLSRLLQKELKDMGIDIIMDDFGMGHSSISYLQNNKFNYVKIDGELVKHIMDNERSCNIIEMVCNLSERLDFDVIAEYVETKEQRDKLLEMGCHLYQGYLYSPAVPFDKLVEYMQKYNAFGNKAK